MKRISIAIAVLADGPGMVALGLAEHLRKSAQLAASLPGERSAELQVRLVGEGRSVRVADGTSLSCDGPFASTRSCRLAIIPTVHARVRGSAKRELRSSRQPLSTIASRVGYTDVVAFRKVFVRVTGVTLFERCAPNTLTLLPSRI